MMNHCCFITLLLAIMAIHSQVADCSGIATGIEGTCDQDCNYCKTFSGAFGYSSGDVTYRYINKISGGCCMCLDSSGFSPTQLYCSPIATKPDCMCQHLGCFYGEDIIFEGDWEPTSINCRSMNKIDSLNGTIYLSDDHQILTKEGFIESRNLHKGHQLIYNKIYFSDVLNITKVYFRSINVKTNNIYLVNGFTLRDNHPLNNNFKFKPSTINIFQFSKNNNKELDNLLKSNLKTKVHKNLRCWGEDIKNFQSLINQYNEN